jgi:RimJ/RimL family protein N-acetyltransferase
MASVDGAPALLRPLAADELERVYAWYNEPERVAPFDRFSLEPYDEFARSVREAPNDPSSLAPRLAVVERASGALAGVVGHYRPHPVLEYVEVWYLIGEPSARGKGLGKAAVRLLVSELFRSTSLERVGANCDVDNVPSVRLLEGLGFRLEGTLRSALFHHGRWHDVRLYGITRSEWTDPTRRS